jgi:hypothetical protein
MDRVPKVVGAIQGVGVEEPGVTRRTPPIFALPIKRVPSELAARLSGYASAPGRVIAGEAGATEALIASSVVTPARNTRRHAIDRL